jgi:hypothetical protein
MVALIRPNDAEMTLQERHEVELAYNGPIPPQAIADKIAQRRVSPLTRDEILALIRQKSADLNYYQQMLLKDEGSHMRAFDRSQIRKLDAEISALDDRLSEMAEPMNIAAE